MRFIYLTAEPTGLENPDGERSLPEIHMVAKSGQD